MSLRTSNLQEYRIWKAMKARCYAPSFKDFRGYQQKGIIVCDRWKNSFENFLNDIGKRPSKNHSIDRINNDGNYEPGNCRWATRKEQCDNRGDFNDLITFNNKTQTLKDWSRELNIKYTTLYQRIYRHGLLFTDAIKDDPFNHLVEYNNEKLTMIEWSKKLGIKYQILVDRKRKGWSIERILTQPVKEIKY